MKFRSVDAPELKAIVERDLTQCSAELRQLFSEIAIQPVRWSQSPWGDQSGGFWAVATHQDQVLWYNDIEEGFNVSHFVTAGEIPNDEYSSNQDDLCEALARLK